MVTSAGRRTDAPPRHTVGPAGDQSLGRASAGGREGRGQRERRKDGVVILPPARKKKTQAPPTPPHEVALCMYEFVCVIRGVIWERHRLVIRDLNF